MPSLQNPTFDRASKLASYARFARYATVLLLMLLFFATHYPVHGQPLRVASADKFAHCLAYMVLSLSVLVSWDLSIGRLQPHHYFTVWLVGTLYGAFDEITQIPVGRHCDAYDWLCDIAGIILGLTLFRIFRPLLFRHVCETPTR